MMLKKKGYKFHKQIFKTYSRHPKYYCIETPNVLNDLTNSGELPACHKH